ncbi:uncharacterized protein [Hyperolius riggenbachi]|uniref:uncharacterized protein n=1 Tax=Hyperolius riggenbachi TaxID=752182 RepID=UPI0035A291AA
MPKCAVTRCHHRSGKKTTYPHIILHPFPKNITHIQEWLRLAGVEEDDLELISLEILEDKRSDKFRMCSAHFTQDSYVWKGSKRVLKVGARPSKFPEKSLLDFAKPPMMHKIIKRVRIKKSLAQAPVPVVVPVKVKCLCKCHVQLKSRLVNTSTQTEPLGVLTLSSVDPCFRLVEGQQIGNEHFTMGKDMDAVLVPSLEIIPVKDSEMMAFQIKDVENPNERVLRPSQNTGSQVGDSEQEDEMDTNELSFFEVITVDDWESVVTQLKQASSQSENGTLHSENTILDRTTTEKPSPVPKPSQNGEDDILEIQTQNNETGHFHGDAIKSTSDGLSTGKRVHKKQSYGKKHTEEDEEGKVQREKQVEVQIQEDGPCNENGHLSTQGSCSLTDNGTGNIPPTVKHKRKKKNTENKLSDSLKQTDSNVSSSVSSDEDNVPLPLEEEYAKEKKYVVFESCLDELLFNMRCRQDYCCEKIKEFDKHTVGSLLVVSGTCCRGHNLKLWESQPRVNGVGAGNVLLATLLVLTGSSFAQIKGLCDIISLQIFSESSFHRYEDKYIFPSIDQWIQEEDESKMASTGHGQEGDVTLDEKRSMWISKDKLQAFLFHVGKAEPLLDEYYAMEKGSVGGKMLPAMGEHVSGLRLHRMEDFPGRIVDNSGNGGRRRGIDQSGRRPRMPACIVKGCSFHWRQKDPDITLHVFPRNVELIKTWLLQIFKEGKDLDEFATKIFNSKKGVYRICSKHFTSASYEKRLSGKVLRKDAIPTIFPSIDHLLDEEHKEHPYAKKKRLQMAAESAETISSQDMNSAQVLNTTQETDSAHVLTSTLDMSVQDETLTQEAIDPSVPSTSAFIAAAEEFVLSQQSWNISSRSYLDFPSPQYIDLCSTGAGDDSFLPSQSADDMSSISLPRKRKYQPRSKRTTGTLTEYFPGQKHKSVQFDKSMGTKDKSMQICRRPPHRSIAIQCNLVTLPALTHARDVSSEHKTQKLGEPSSDSTMTFEDIIECIEEEEEPVSPGWSSCPASPDGESSIKDHLLSEPRSESRQPNNGFGLSASKLGADHNLPQHNDERISKDPKDVDVSPILLPENHTSDEVNDRKFIVFESCLNKLLLCCKCLGMANCCGNITKLKKYQIGSAIMVTAICSLKHEFHLWTSQPLIGHMPVGNLLISAGILCSGLSFTKVKSLFHLMGILGISKSTHHNNETLYLFPTIDRHWNLERSRVIRAVGITPVVLVGDCRRESPGFGSKCCTYSFLEYQSKKIIDFQVENVSPSTSLADLENKACGTALDRLMKEKVNVCIVCTDRNAGIRRFLKKHYRHIKHQLEIWHFTKFVSRKISVASRKRNCRQLATWVGPAKNHLWWSANTCDQNPLLLKEKWTSIIHHAANQHQWNDARWYHSCCHCPLFEEEERGKEWLKAGSSAHSALAEVVRNKNLMDDLEHLSHFCHAGELEVYHCTSQKYCEKGNHYSYWDLVARSQLAALDYNRNIDQMQAVVKAMTSYGDEQGTPRQRCSYRQAKKDLVLSRIFDHTNQDFMKAIMADVLFLASGEKKNHAWTSRCKEASTNTSAP